MKKQKVLYAITVEDIINVSKEENIPFSEKNIDFIADKIGDFLGNYWYDAVEYGLQELKRENN